MDNSLIAYVMGVTFANADGSSRQEIIRNCKQGDELILLREPNNRYDIHAIKVCAFKKPGFLRRWLRRKPVLSQLGYLSKYVASRVVPLMEEGVHVQAVVNEIEQSEKVETGQSGTVIETVYECLVEISAENVKWDADRNPVPTK
ncbi:MAG: HIRAN domain-containing protein [Deltaproteobacteria bacterium]|nr:MAG: HIRAN domain-containing protein [Deltaproteobacteria bacterium]